MGKFSKLLGKCVIIPILVYRYFISPVLGKHCRFEPTCSAYAQTAIERFGIIHGIYLAMKRILSCHPWHDGGIDPVPEKHN